MSQLVTIAAGNGANSGRTVPLVAIEVATFDLDADLTVDVHIGVVDVDGCPRRYRLADLAGAGAGR